MATNNTEWLKTSTQYDNAQGIDSGDEDMISEIRTMKSSHQTKGATEDQNATTHFEIPRSTPIRKTKFFKSIVLHPQFFEGFCAFSTSIYSIAL